MKYRNQTKKKKVNKNKNYGSKQERKKIYYTETWDTIYSSSSGNDENNVVVKFCIERLIVIERTKTETERN